MVVVSRGKWSMDIKPQCHTWGNLKIDTVRDILGNRVMRPTGNPADNLYQVAEIDMDKVFEEAWQKQSLSAVENRE